MAVTVKCVVEWGARGGSNVARPKLEIKKFDGVSWEASFAASNIAAQSSQWSGDALS
jgi:hypothetical protein